ncbi:LemA family protein [Hydrogenimonas urashimensis]|uniref:LemA family protein n=1 Tax=Hydrogenimonas urashimensis TaxID=2740515 RepID=UPI00191679A1|nr:LemA family protein [Hydrogenimonas urashimensis]
MGLWIFLGIVAAVVLYFIAIYNKFVSLRAAIDSSWSDIDVQLKRRANLIPALVKTVKSYKNYEQETLEKVIEARQRCENAKEIKEKAAAQNALTHALGGLFALAEAYPELKADTQFTKLQNELSAIEEAIQNARRYYNAVVRDYNAKLHSFPDLLVANKFNFKERDYFELEEPSERKMPDIDL